MFGSVSGDTIIHLESALDGVIGERGHRLELVHNDPQLVQAEEHIRQAICLLEVYRTKGGN